MKRALHPAWLLPAAILLASCATSSGSLLQRVKETEAAEAPQERKPQPIVETPSTPKKGLKIVSTPTDAEVYLNGIYKGHTPLAIEELDKGTYKILVQKPGFHPFNAWIEYLGDPMVFVTALQEITGFLLVRVDPPSAAVHAGDQRLSAGISELRIGSYEITAREFGYEEFRTRVEILEGTRTEVSVDLVPSRFAVKDLALKRARVNPDNPGLLGVAEIAFRVTAAGTGELAVRDASSATVCRIPLDPFSTWDQEVIWNLTDSEGRRVADGSYVISLSAAGQDGESVSSSVTVSVDRSLVIAPRSLWSGSSGLLYAPSADCLPDGVFQGSLLLSANIAEIRVPSQLAFRLGVSEDWELGAGIGLILGSSSLPVLASLALRHTLVSPGSRFGFGAAVETRLSWQFLATTDLFTDFSGLALEVPMQFTAGPCTLLAAAQVVVSPWKISYDSSTTTDIGFHSWMYLRGGILLDLGSVSAGVSLAVRSADFVSEGLAVGLPFQAGAEAHWVVPGTHMFLSGVLMAEIESASSWYGLGGGGLGLLY